MLPYASASRAHNKSSAFQINVTLPLSDLNCVLKGGRALLNIRTIVGASDVS
jgi:hypothetical protein